MKGYLVLWDYLLCSHQGQIKRPSGTGVPQSMQRSVDGCGFGGTTVDFLVFSFSFFNIRPHFAA